MPAHLILNADDFGLTRGVNRAIGELSAAGVLTSATLMASGGAFDNAVAVAQAHPRLAVGCHVVLTDGVPLSAPHTIPTLIGPDGKSFRPLLRDFLGALFTGRIRQQDVFRESLAQIQRLQAAGLSVTHVDSHKHTHLFPRIARPLLQAAEQCRVRAVRNPFEPSWAFALKHGGRSRRVGVKVAGLLRSRFEALPQIRSGAIRTTHGTVAISATGQLDSPALAEILAALPSTGTYELCCHPGYNDRDLANIATRLRAHRDAEREALLVEVPRLLRTPNSPRLISYEPIAF